MIKYAITLRGRVNSTGICTSGHMAAIFATLSKIQWSPQYCRFPLRGCERAWFAFVLTSLCRCLRVCMSEGVRLRLSIQECMRVRIRVCVSECAKYVRADMLASTFSNVHIHFTHTCICSVQVIVSFTIEIFPNQLQNSDTSPKEFFHTNHIMHSLHLKYVKPPRSARPPLRQ